jgi:ArsR family transcriptional regulator
MDNQNQSCKPCEQGSTILVSHISPSDEALAELAWAIAHPARVKLVRLLLERSNCVCGELVGLMPLAQSTVSQHLKILKDAGIVQGEIDGPRVCYCINTAGLARLKALVAEL